MAGLLDFLMTPESQLGIGLLAAAGSGRSFGEGLLGATQSVAAQRRGLLQDKLLQSQVDENTSQAEMRKQQLAMAKRQMEIDNSLLGYGARPDAGYVAPSAGGSASPALMGAPASSGATAPTVSTPGGPMSLSQLSSAYGIPYEALAFDLVKNGGKGISDMIYKRGTPDIQVSNGYAYDKNRLGAGFLPSLSTAQDGKTSMVRIGADGLPVVSAPQGSVETYGAYQRAAADNKPIKVYNPATGREEYTSEGSVVRGAQGGASMPPIRQDQAPTGGRPAGIPSPYNGGSPASAALEQIATMQYELGKLPEGHPARAGIMREIARLEGSVPRGQTPQSGNYAAGPSAAEKTAQEAARIKAVKQAEVDVTPTAQKVSNVDTAMDALAVIDQALNHPGLQTATGLRGSLDPRNYIAGTDATNFRVLLDQVKGGVFLDAYKDLRGAGQITEVEGQKAEAAKARINRAQSPDEVVKGLKEYRAVVERGYERARQNLPAGSGASGSWDAPAAGQQSSAPRATMRFNPQTGRLEKVN